MNPGEEWKLIGYVHSHSGMLMVADPQTVEFGWEYDLHDLAEANRDTPVLSLAGSLAAVDNEHGMGMLYEPPGSPTGGACIRPNEESEVAYPVYARYGRNGNIVQILVDCGAEIEE